jgi:hypothetical protein
MESNLAESIYIVFNPFNKGKGLWKFNNSLLHDKDYSKIVREKIINLKKQYAALIHLPLSS